MSENKKPKKRTESKKEEISKIENKIEKNIEKAEETEEKKEHPTKKQLISENKILIITLSVIVLLVAVFVFVLILSNSSRSFVLNQVRYTLIPEGQGLVLYNAKIPLAYQGKNADYNIYLSNDPRILQKEIPFNGTLYIRPNVVLNSSSNLSNLMCNGDGIVAVARLIDLYQGALGVNVTKQADVTCDSQARYVFINIQSSNETSIQEIAPACYNINVNNCQILPAVERYMTETISKVHQYLNLSS